MVTLVTSRYVTAFFLCCLLLTAALSILHAGTTSLDYMSTAAGGISATPAVKRLTETSMHCQFNVKGSAPVTISSRANSRGVQTLTTVDFESASLPSGWQALGNPTWGRTSAKAYGGQYSAWCAAGGTAGMSPGMGYPNNYRASLVFGPFSLQDATAATLAFQLNNNPAGNDVCARLASIDGSNFYGIGTSGNSNGWVQKTLDLANIQIDETNTLNCCGHSQVWIEILFVSGTASSSSSVGSYIDDITVQKTTATVTHTVTPTAGAHGAISPSTPQTVNDGSSVTFTATPDSGYQISGWYLDGNSSPVQSSGASYTLTNVTADHSVNVSFTPIGNGTWQTIDAEGFEGSTTPGWTYTSVVTGCPTWGITSYKANSGTHSAWCAASGSGAVSPSAGYPNNCDGRMTYGPFSLQDATAAKLTFMVNSDTEPNYDYFRWYVSVDGSNFYGFKNSGNTGGWVEKTLDLTNIATSTGTLNCCGYSQVWVELRFTSDSSNTKTYGGTFIDDILLQKQTAPSTHTVTPSTTPSTGAQGTISPSTPQTVNDGESVTFTAAPNTGYLVNGWYLDGGTSAVQTGGNTFTLSNVKVNHAVSVSFKAQVFTITPSSGGNGSISPSTAQAINYGGSVTFTATPNTGYQVDGWYLDNATTAAQVGGATYALTNVKANHTVKVTFKPVVPQFTITPSAGTGGAISPSIPQTVNSGSSVTFTATPLSGYAVDGWYLDSATTATQIGGTTYKLTNIDANHAVKVTFKTGTFKVTPVAGTGGVISPNTVQTVNAGGSVTFTATLNTGYQVDSWSMGSIKVQSGGATYKCTPTADCTVTVAFARIIAVRTLPTGYAPGQAFTVSIAVTPDSSAMVYGVEETPPTGWTVGTINESGQFDATNSKVKWGPFFDNTARTLSYTLTPPTTATGTKTFSGVISVDGKSTGIGGMTSINPMTLHPADTDSNASITLDEMTAYGAAWKKGANWPTPPAQIPLDYMTNAGMIWKKGEVYHFDAAQQAPNCWVPGLTSPLRAPKAATNTAVRTLSAHTNLVNKPITVNLLVTPASTITCYAIEEIPPTGWAVTGITFSGTFDASNHKVKWGPFFDTTVRTLSYTLTPPTGSLGSYSFTGAASFDGKSITVSGDTSINIVTVLPVYQPDLSVANGTDTSYLGLGILNTTGVGQTKSQTVTAGATAKYALQLRNSGNTADVFTLSCPAVASGWKVQVIDYASGKDITATVTGAGNPTARLAVNGVLTYIVYVTPARTQASGSTCSLLLTEVSTADGNKKDAVKLLTTAGPLYQPDLTVRNPSDNYLGGGVFNLDGTGQACTQTVPPGVPSCFFFRVQNAGNTTDSYLLTGPAASSGWTVAYFDMTTLKSLTTLFTGTAGLATGALAPGASKGYFVQVTPSATVLTGAAFTLRVTAVSVANTTVKDVVKTVTTDGGGVCLRIQ